MTDPAPQFIGMGEAAVRRADGRVEPISVAIIQTGGWRTLHFPESLVLMNNDTLCMPEEQMNEAMRA